MVGTITFWVTSMLLHDTSCYDVTSCAIPMAYFLIIHPPPAILFEYSLVWRHLLVVLGRPEITISITYGGSVPENKP